MISKTQILASGTTSVFTAAANSFINRLSIVNVAGSASTVNLYKVVAGVSYNIIPKDYSLGAGSALIITDGLAITTGQGLSVATTQATHVDINVN